MDINEFSVACKLITNKLKGVEIPKVLPPSMIPQTAMQAGMMPGMMQQPGMVRMNAAGKITEKCSISIFLPAFLFSISYLFLYEKLNYLVSPCLEMLWVSLVEIRNTEFTKYTEYS